jgi:hypothetical protein
MKNLYFVPMVSQADVEDIPNLLENRRPLAYCLAFIASRFTPGQDSMHEQLMPYIAQFLKGATYLPTRSEEEHWMHLQVFAVLYAYTQIPKSEAGHLEPVRNSGLEHWTLKSAVETYALQLSLHRSIEDVKILLRNNCPDIATKNCYRNSVYWLWLFTMAHHHSLITRTPPSIRLDSAISGSLDILKTIPNDTSIMRVLAEVDLCVLWSQLARVERGFGEWWCPPPEARDAHEILRRLEDADAALQSWGQKWMHLPNEAQRPSIFNNAYPESSATEFHFRVTRFCISTFATLISYDQSTLPPPEAISAIMQSVLKSTDAAGRCCDLLIELGPLHKESLRYSPDFAFTMVSFCCLYLIHAQQLLGSKYPSLSGQVAKVKQVASLMSDLSVGQNQCPRLYGEWILARLQSSVAGHNTNSSIQPEFSQGREDSNQSQMAGSRFDVIRGENEAVDQYPSSGQIWPNRRHDTGAVPGLSSTTAIFNAGHSLFDDYEIDYSFIFDPTLDFVT